MPIKTLSLLALLFPLLLVSCGDLPSAPTREVSGVAPLMDCFKRSDGTVICERVVAEVPSCDPYHYDCGEDDCIMTADTGCGGGGGGTPPPPGDDGSGGGGGGGTGPAPGPSPICPDQGCEPPPCDANTPLPYDSDGDCDTWDEGPGVWIACISAVLGTGFAGGATYYAMEDYHHKVAMYHAARLRYQASRAQYGDSHPETARLYTEMADAERQARNAAGIAATAGGVTVTSLITAGVLCAPLIFAPTP